MFPFLRKNREDNPVDSTDSSTSSGMFSTAQEQPSEEPLVDNPYDHGEVSGDPEELADKSTEAILDVSPEDDHEVALEDPEDPWSEEHEDAGDVEAQGEPEETEEGTAEEAEETEEAEEEQGSKQPWFTFDTPVNEVHGDSHDDEEPADDEGVAAPTLVPTVSPGEVSEDDEETLDEEEGFDNQGSHEDAGDEEGDDDRGVLEEYSEDEDHPEEVEEEALESEDPEDPEEAEEGDLEDPEGEDAAEEALESEEDTPHDDDLESAIEMFERALEDDEDEDIESDVDLDDTEEPEEEETEEEVTQEDNEDDTGHTEDTGELPEVPESDEDEGNTEDDVEVVVLYDPSQEEQDLLDDSDEEHQEDENQGVLPLGIDSNSARVAEDLPVGSLVIVASDDDEKIANALELHVSDSPVYVIDMTAEENAYDLLPASATPQFIDLPDDQEHSYLDARLIVTEASTKQGSSIVIAGADRLATKVLDMFPHGSQGYQLIVEYCRSIARNANLNGVSIVLTVGDDHEDLSVIAKDIQLS